MNKENPFGFVENEVKRNLKAGAKIASLPVRRAIEAETPLLKIIAGEQLVKVRRELAGMRKPKTSTGRAYPKRLYTIPNREK